jgi:hypothetical protein
MIKKIEKKNGKKILRKMAKSKNGHEGADNSSHKIGCSPSLYAAVNSTSRGHV